MDGMNQQRRLNIADAILLASREAALNSRANNTRDKFIRSVCQYAARTAPNLTATEVDAVLLMSMAEAFGVPAESKE